MLGYDNLGNYYKTNFALMQHHKYSITDLENMMPWERYLYIDLLKEHVRETNEKLRDQAAAINAKRRIGR
jgi:hypothetical protein